MFHLVCGNAIIGLFEGGLLSRFFHTPKWSSILTLICANYVSAWLGWALLLSRLVHRVTIHVENLRFWFWLFILLAFVLTLVVEFPFVFFLLRKSTRAFRKSTLAILTIQGSSYACMLVLYLSVSNTSLLTEVQIVDARSLRPPEYYELYGISPDGQSIFKSDLAGEARESVREILAPNRNDRLFARESETPGFFDLYIHLEDSLLRDNSGRPESREVLILEGFSSSAPIGWRIEGKPQGTRWNFGPVPKLTESDWEFSTNFWPASGLKGVNAAEGKSFRLALESPFLSWNFRNVVHLDGDLLAFQMGEQQICLFDPEEKKIALIVLGKGPLVAAKLDVE